MARAEGSSLEQAFGLRPRRFFVLGSRLIYAPVWVLVWEFPPERQLIAPLYSGGQSGLLCSGLLSVLVFVG